jgi:hypothetical protein
VWSALRWVRDLLGPDDPFNIVGDPMMATPAAAIVKGVGRGLAPAARKARSLITGEELLDELLARPHAAGGGDASLLTDLLNRPYVPGEASPLSELLARPEALPGVQGWMTGKGPAAKARIESARAILAGEDLSPADLKALLAEFNPRDAAKAVKGMPVTPRSGPLGRGVVNTADPGIYAAAEDLARRIEDFHRIGVSLPKQVTWGPSTHPELVHGFGGERELADLFGQIFAATSANTSVAKNTAEAVSVLNYLYGNPQHSVFTPEILQNLPFQKVTQAPSKTPNVNKAFWGIDLGGPKVGPFGAFMSGAGHAAPDVHALYGWGTKSKAITEELPNLRTRFTKAEGLPRSGGLTDDELVDRFLTATNDVLDSLEPGRPTAGIFGDFWEGVRAHKGQGYQGSYIDILRNKGLLEFGKMLDRRALVKALKEGGWSALAIGGLTTALDEEGGSQVGAPPPRPSY